MWLCNIQPKQKQCPIALSISFSAELELRLFVTLCASSSLRCVCMHALHLIYVMEKQWGNVCYWIIIHSRCAWVCFFFQNKVTKLVSLTYTTTSLLCVGVSKWVFLHSKLDNCEIHHSFCCVSWKKSLWVMGNNQEINVDLLHAGSEWNPKFNSTRKNKLALESWNQLWAQTIRHVRVYWIIRPLE